MSVLSASCVHWPEVGEDCASFGVAENQQPLGQIVYAKPLYHEELDMKCGQVARATAQLGPDHVVKGCVIPHRDGTVNAFYSVGDKCAMHHELCHALHGVRHTQRYLDDVERGIPQPYCPPNQFAMGASGR